jgi:HAD domain in Swiss Army Knife RNA repair proteins
VTEGPLVLLDVDGVLNPVRRSSPRFRRHDVVVDGLPYTVLLNPGHGPRLLALSQETGAELAWATTWEDHANEEIAPRIGLPLLPVVPLNLGTARPEGVHFKTVHVAEYVRGRPFVWFDDGHLDADREYLHGHPGVGEFLLVDVDPGDGLADQHLDVARKWLAAVTA